MEAVADDKEENTILAHVPLLLPQQHQQGQGQDQGQQTQQTEGVETSNPLILAPSAPLSVDISLATPNICDDPQDVKNPDTNNGVASASLNPLSVNVDVSSVKLSSGDPSSVSANAPLLDSPKLLSNVVNKQIYHIPEYSGWFSSNKIHAIERRSMAEFFDGSSISKTPKLYKEYRDFIINKCKENPGKLLTFTEVRRMLVGDVNVIKRLFDFLEYWGLINYYNIPEKKHQASYSDKLEATPSSSSETVPPGVQIVYPHIPVGISKPKGSMESSGKSARVLSSTNLVSYKDAFVTSMTDATPITSNESPVNLDTFNCSSCKANCQIKYYENAKKEGVLLCAMCFLTGNDFIRDDFVLRGTESLTSDSLKEAKANAPQNDWTKEEVLRLLEALTKYKENWDLIARHVETRSKAECIMQFMKLPFGDQFVYNNGVDNCMQDNMATVIETEIPHMDIHRESRDSDGTDVMEVEGVDEHLDCTPPFKRSRIKPHATAGNPILAQVAFLSAMVGPRVAAAAAQASLIALADEDPISSQFLSSILPNQRCTALSSGSQIGSGKENLEIEFKESKGDLTSGKEDVETESSLQALPSATQIRAGIATAIGATAANAKLLADQEEREIEHLMAVIIENQLKKLSCKVEHFKELEHLLKEEHIQIGRAQTQVLADWIRFSHYNYSARRG